MLRIEENAILVFNYGAEIHAEILSCFLSEGEHLLFPDFTGWDEGGFIEERTVIRSTDWIYDWVEERHQWINWYKPQNDTELIKILKDQGTHYSCVVIPKEESDIKNFKYLMFVYEHCLFDGEEIKALFVQKERDEGSFAAKVVPRLQEKLIHIAPNYSLRKSFRRLTVYAQKEC